MRIYFLFQKNTHTNKKISNSKFIRIVQIYIFSLQKIKDRAFCFSTKKSAARVDF